MQIASPRFSLSKSKRSSQNNQTNPAEENGDPEPRSGEQQSL